jgi:hypothetical protein
MVSRLVENVLGEGGWVFDLYSMKTNSSSDVFLWPVCSCCRVVNLGPIQAVSPKQT